MYITFPRLMAAIFVLLVIGFFVLTGIGSLLLVKAETTQSMKTDHDAGTITMIQSNMRGFTLRIADGKQVYFQCSRSCNAALHHMERHRTEMAHTDVYYIEEANNTLLALNVD